MMFQNLLSSTLRWFVATRTTCFLLILYALGCSLVTTSQVQYWTCVTQKAKLVTPSPPLCVVVIRLSFFFRSHSRTLVCTYSLSCFFIILIFQFLSHLAFFMQLLLSAVYQFGRFYNFGYWIHWSWLKSNWQFVNTVATTCTCRGREDLQLFYSFY